MQSNSKLIEKNKYQFKAETEKKARAWIRHLQGVVGQEILSDSVKELAKDAIVDNDPPIVAFSYDDAKMPKAKSGFLEDLRKPKKDNKMAERFAGLAQEMVKSGGELQSKIDNLTTQRKMQDDLQKKLTESIAATGNQDLVSQFTNLTQLWDIHRLTTDSVID